MPVNAPPEFFEAKREYEKESDPKKKIKKLEHLISVTPKHKGAEKLLMQLKKKLSKLKTKVAKRKKAGGGGFGISVKKEGAAQVALLGLPNSGKSTLLAGLTNANPVISRVPFSTQQPEVGTMKYLNVRVQIVEIPPIIPGGSDNPKWLSIARNADLIILVVDSTRDDDLKKLRKELSREGIDNQTMVVRMKADISGDENAINPDENRDFEDLKTEIWKELNLIRVYTRTRHTEPDKKNPVTLSEDATVEDLAKKVHKDFVKNLKHARIWRGNFKGLKAGDDYELEDGDVVELVI